MDIMLFIVGIEWFAWSTDCPDFLFPVYLQYMTAPTRIQYSFLFK